MSEIPINAPKIMLIRHAEKPLRYNHYGVTKKGKHETQSLSVRGWQRAGALASFFAPANGSFQDASLAAPQFLYAAKPVKHDGSRRPVETLTPLAKKIALEINKNFTKFEVEQMLNDALRCNGAVLICWQREYLPQIANRILGDDATAPQQWSDDRFDIVWLFERDVQSGKYRFRQIPQNLLAGDSPLT